MILFVAYASQLADLLAPHMNYLIANVVEEEKCTIVNGIKITMGGLYQIPKYFVFAASVRKTLSLLEKNQSNAHMCVANDRASLCCYQFE